MKKNNLDNYIEKGVVILSPETTFISGDVVIGMGTVIYPNTTIIGNVEIGNDCKIGPSAYIREGTKVGNNSKIGCFVEVKKSIIKDCVRIGHLSYVGNAFIESNTNIGAGVVFANYDGKNKNNIEVNKNCFIGSNSTLIAPLVIGENVLIAAGSTITRDVEKNLRAFARSRQENK